MISLTADSVITTLSASNKSFTFRFDGNNNFTLGMFLAANSKLLFSAALTSAIIKILPATFNESNTDIINFVFGSAIAKSFTTTNCSLLADNADFTSATKYKALGKGSNGEFAVKLQNLANGGLTGNTVYARAYYGTDHAAKYVKLSINGATDVAGELLK